MCAADQMFSGWMEDATVRIQWIYFNSDTAMVKSHYIGNYIGNGLAIIPPVANSSTADSFISPLLWKTAPILTDTYCWLSRQSFNCSCLFVSKQLFPAWKQVQLVYKLQQAKTALQSGNSGHKKLIPTLGEIAAASPLKFSVQFHLQTHLTEITIYFMKRKASDKYINYVGKYKPATGLTCIRQYSKVINSRQLYTEQTI